jgi:hypothetical protein
VIDFAELKKSAHDLEKQKLDAEAIVKLYKDKFGSIEIGNRESSLQTRV